MAAYPAFIGALTVYLVEPLLMDFHSLAVDLPEKETSELFSTPHERWSAPPVCIDDTPRTFGESNERLLIPDIWYLTTLRRLVFTEAQVGRLEPYLSLAGDLVPLRDASSLGRKFFMLAITNQKPIHQCINVSVGYERRQTVLERWLAQANHVIAAEQAETIRELASNGDPWPYLLPAFIADGLGDDLTFFTTDHLPQIFLLDRDDSNDSLLRRITELGLTGIATEAVWSSTRGYQDINLYD